MQLRARRLECGNAIRNASFEGHASVVKLLLTNQRVHPTTHNKIAIVDASCRGHSGVVKLLLADPRVDHSLGHATRPEYQRSGEGYVDVVVKMFNTAVTGEGCDN
jgi:hypothetical protein